MNHRQRRKADDYVRSGLMVLVCAPGHARGTLDGNIFRPRRRPASRRVQPTRRRPVKVSSLLRHEADVIDRDPVIVSDLRVDSAQRLAHILEAPETVAHSVVRRQFAEAVIPEW